MFALRTSGIQALKALLELALDPPRWRSVTDLAAAQNLPPPMLEQVLLRLRRAGLVESRRGRRGGYRLRGSPADLPLAEILAAAASSPAPAPEPPHPGAPAESEASDQVATALQRRLRRALERELAQLTLEELLFDLRSTRASLREEGGLLLG